MFELQIPLQDAALLGTESSISAMKEIYSRYQLSVDLNKIR